MFGRKNDKPKKDHSGKNLAQYGLFEVPSELSFDDSEVHEDDSDLEAELLALTSGSNSKPRPKPKAKVLPTADLDILVASSLRDIPSDEELSGDDDDDPDLIDELKELTQEDRVEDVESQPETTHTADSNSTNVDVKKILDERLKMYELAEANAKKGGDSSRARRFNRGIKTLKDLIRQANAGKIINNDDIPPEVSVNIPSKPPVQPVEPMSENETTIPDPIPEPLSIPEPDSTSESKPEPNKKLLEMLIERRDQYKIAAVKNKRSGNVQNAVRFMKIAKQFEAVIKAVENGEPVDLSQMPGPPEEVAQTNQENESSENQNQGKEESETQGNTENSVQGDEEEPVELITAGSIMEALQQRLQVYKSQEEAAKTEGNSSKSRRMGRIVKQFEQAIKLHQAGKPIPIGELPTPPGYAPIPDAANSNPTSNNATNNNPQPSATPQRPAPSPPSSSQSSTTDPPKPPPRGLPRMNSARKMGNQVSNNRIEKQVEMLLARQRDFKEAALQAKKKGEIAQAKELLRTAKGFDKVIDAARGGFPVDMDSLPIPTGSRSVLEESYEVVLAEECKEDDTGTMEMLSRLIEQLTKQLKMCLSTRDHHKALGDITGVNRFENLALSVTKDLDIVRLAYRMGETVPKFHYENKSFTIVKCCTDLNDNDLELNIIRGINYNCPNPKEVDTYVKIEFPFPQEEPFKERTAIIKDTNNPEYNGTFTIPIQRTSRQCLRVFKRHSVKLEVYSRGGFFRSDQLLGTAQVKLQPLETQCEIHDSFELMDGRKKVGGNLEVKLRVRNPMVTRQVEQINEKWLVIDH